MSTATTTPTRKFIMNDPLQDLRGLDGMDPEHIHGEYFIVLWALTREPESRREDLERIAQDCIDFADASVGCLKKGRPHFAIRKFVNAIWNDRSVDTMARVFKAYVDNGIIDVDQVLDGEPALAGAILNGNIHTAEHLVLHGASTTGQDGQCLFELAKIDYGRDSVLSVSEELRAGAAARLIGASMRREIDAASEVVGDAKEALSASPQDASQARLHRSRRVL